MPCCSRIFLKSIFWPLKHDFKTETCNFNLPPWILLEPITILLEIYWNPTKVLMEPVGVLLKHSGVLNWSSAKSLKIASFCWNILKRSEKTDQRNYSYQDLIFSVAWDIKCYLWFWFKLFFWKSSKVFENILWRQITQSFLPVRVVFSLKTRARWKIHLFTSQLNLPKFGKCHLFFLNHVGNLRKGLLTTYQTLVSTYRVNFDIVKD